MRTKRKKAFTLIELLGVVVILGIIIALAIVSYSSYLNSAKKKAFNVEEINFMDAARSAYADCLTNNPNNEFCSNHVSFDEKYQYDFVYLSELVDDSYIREIKNPYDTSEFCSLDKSYVYVSRKNSTQSNNADMVYNACLVCGDNKSADCLDNLEDIPTFETTCTAYYDAVGGPLYDGKWTDRNVYLVFGATGNYRYGINEFEYTVGGNGDTRIDANSNNNGILVLNKTVDNKQYKVQAFDGMNGAGSVVSCKGQEGADTNIKIDKASIDNVNITAKTVSGTNVQSSDNKWLSEQIKLTANVQPSTSTSGYLYQWYKDGEKYGTQTTTDTLTISTSGSYKVEVTNRVGEIVKTSNDFVLKIDTATPKCTILANGTKATSKWYSEDVVISLDIEETASGVGVSSFTPQKITTNTSGTTISGMVTSVAGKTGTCSAVIKLDKSTPSFKVIASDDVTTGNWHKADFTITAKDANNISGNTYYHGNATNPTTSGSSDTVSSNTTGTTYYYKVCSGAGICNEMSYNAKLDETTPSFKVVSSDNVASNSWHKVDFTITASGASNISGNTYYHGTASTPTTNASTTGSSQTVNTTSTTSSGTTYYFRVCSGSGNCNVISYIAKLDKGSPTITAKGSSYYITTSTGAALTGYFNITPGVSGGTTLCKVGSTTVNNTNNLSLGINTVTCTVTNGVGRTASASTVFKHQYSSTATCSKGTLNSSRTSCNYSDYVRTDYSCPSGYTLSGTTCSKTTTQSASCSLYPKCTLYTITASCKNDDSNATSRNNIPASAVSSNCASLASGLANSCRNSGGVECTQTSSKTERHSACGSKVTVTGSECGNLASCPGGYTKSGYTCTKTETQNATGTPVYNSGSVTPTYSCPTKGVNTSTGASISATTSGLTCSF